MSRGWFRFLTFRCPEVGLGILTVAAAAVPFPIQRSLDRPRVLQRRCARWPSKCRWYGCRVRKRLVRRLSASSSLCIVFCRRRCRVFVDVFFFRDRVVVVVVARVIVRVFCSGDRVVVVVVVTVVGLWCCERDRTSWIFWLGVCPGAVLGPVGWTPPGPSPDGPPKTSRF